MTHIETLVMNEIRKALEIWKSKVLDISTVNRQELFTTTLTEEI